MEIYGNNIIADWNKIIGYDVEDILNSLGYIFDCYDEGESNYDIAKIYKNADKSEGKLLLSHLKAPMFIKIQNGKIRTMINFTRKFQMVEYVFLPDKDLGTIEYGFDVINGGYMHYYNHELYRQKYSDNVNPYTVLPDEIKRVESTIPVEIIGEMAIWGSEIRRSLAPQSNIIVKK